MFSPTNPILFILCDVLQMMCCIFEREVAVYVDLQCLVSHLS